MDISACGLGLCCLRIRALDLFLWQGPWHTLMGGSYPSNFSGSLIQAGEADTHHKYLGAGHECVSKGTVRHISKPNLKHQTFKAREKGPVAGREGHDPVLSWS